MPPLDLKTLRLDDFQTVVTDMKLRKGSHDATGLRFGIVVAKFNKFVTSKLLSSCVEGLTKHGVKSDDIEAVRVPGAFEIPLVARTMARSSRRFASKRTTSTRSSGMTVRRRM